MQKSQIIELLKWYQSNGIYTITRDHISNINSNKEILLPKSENTINNNITTTKSYISMNTKEIILEAKKLADSSNSIEELYDNIRNFDGCLLKKTATNTVISDGNKYAKIMIIGEAPGANEDVQGIPFCGDSGKLLDKMLSHIGLSREENIYITNSIFWRPPGNRKPTKDEIMICRAFVEKHIYLINPRLIILAGSTAVSSILQIPDPITKVRNNFYPYTNSYIENEIKTTAIFHPSYLLRQPSQKKSAWFDLLRIKKYIDDNDILQNV